MYSELERVRIEQFKFGYQKLLFQICFKASEAPRPAFEINRISNTVTLRAVTLEFIEFDDFVFSWENSK